MLEVELLARGCRAPPLPVTPMTPPAADAEERAAALYEDYLRRIDAGERPDLELLCAAHRELEPELRALQRADELLHSLLPGPLEKCDASSGAGSGAGLPCDLAPPDELLHRLRAAGARAERYEVQGEIGRGGMGVVFRVWDKELRRTLAMKVLHRGSARDGAASERALARFLEEAQVTGQLDHPGIVSVHDLGVDAAGQVFFTMHFVRGESLRDILAHVHDGAREWTQVRALGVILKVCEAMSYAHNRDVIHRDLKPSNVMVGEYGEVYVMDWGLARLLGRADAHELRLRGALPAMAQLSTERSDHRERTPDSPLVTADGESVGTPVFMSPEQARGEIEQLGPRADVYSVGAMLYQLVSGDLPFAAELDDPTPRQILARVIAGPPRSLREFGRAIPAELASICERAMARLPEERYPDMHSLGEDLRAYLEDRVVRAHATGTLAETRKWIRRNRLTAASLLVAAALLAVGVVFAVAQVDANERDRVRQTLKAVEAFWAWSADWDAVAPPGPEAYSEWIGRARRLVAELPYQRARLASPPPAALQEAIDRYERVGELQELREELRWRDRALGLQGWPSAVEVRAEVDATLQELHLPEDLATLNKQVFRNVRADEQRILGHEAASVQLAERLVDAARSAGRLHPRYLDTLACAYFRKNLLDRALEVQRDAVAGPFRDDGGSTAADWEFSITENLRFLERMQRQWQDGTARRQRDRLAVELEGMELEIAAVAWRRTGTDDGPLHEDRTRLVAELLRLQERLHLAERAAPDGAAGSGWADAIAAIPHVPVYQGLGLQPQLGLVPLGPDAKSGLWEFADLFTGEPPKRTDGRLDIGPETGIVFVLLPGGSVPVEEGSPRQPFHDEKLPPFFLAKCEVTEHQAIRLGVHRSELGDFAAEVRTRAAAGLSWDVCSRVLTRTGNWLRLPRGPEWEFGARAGTTTSWWTGNELDELRRAGWIAENGKAVGPAGPALKAANAFGLHDVHGNVEEWCMDGRIADPGMILRQEYRMVRGGGYASGPDAARSGNRSQYRLRTSAQRDSGMRPVRCLTR